MNGLLFIIHYMGYTFIPSVMVTNFIYSYVSYRQQTCCRKSKDPAGVESLDLQHVMCTVPGNDSASGIYEELDDDEVDCAGGQHECQGQGEGQPYTHIGQGRDEGQPYTYLGQGQGEGQAYTHLGQGRDEGQPYTHLGLVADGDAEVGQTCSRHVYETPGDHTHVSKCNCGSGGTQADSNVHPTDIENGAIKTISDVFNNMQPENTYLELI